MSARPLELQALLEPKSLAVVGASQRPSSVGRKVLVNLAELGYAGTVYAINPKYDEVEGIACYPSLADLPEVPDCVALSVPSGGILAALAEAIDAGSRSAVVFASGFGEVAGGDAVQQELADVARRSGVPVCGPNCLGFLNVSARVGLYSPALPPVLHSGRVGLVSQTGSGCIALTSANRVGFSYVVSSGNEAVVSAEDYAEFLVDDAQTDVVGIVAESLRQPDKLARAARRAAELGKPVVVLKVGRSEIGAVAARAHTGSMVGDHDVFQAFCDRHGIVTVDDLDEMLDQFVLHTSATPPQRARGVGVLTISGGQAAMVCDHADKQGLPLARLSPDTVTSLRELLPDYVNINNPLDIGGAGVGAWDTYEACLEALLRDPAVDAVLVAQDAPAGMNERQCREYLGLVERIPRAAVRVGKPVVFGTHIGEPVHARIAQALDEGGIPLVQGTRRSVVALRKAYGWEAPAGEERERAAAPGQDAPSGDGVTLLHPERSRALLEGYGIRMPAGRLAATPGEAAEAARSLHGPATLKIASPDVVHKTDVGGVRVGLGSAELVHQAATEMLQRVGREAPGAKVWGLTVEETVAGEGTDAFVGVRNDDHGGYGASLALGPGGVLLDLFKDGVAVGLLPRDDTDVQRLVDRTCLRDLLGGLRGAPPGDRDALVGLVLSLGRLVADHVDEIVWVDLNPVRVLPRGSGAVVLDAKLMTREATGAGDREKP